MFILTTLSYSFSMMSFNTSCDASISFIWSFQYSSFFRTFFTVSCRFCKEVRSGSQTELEIPTESFRFSSKAVLSLTSTPLPRPSKSIENNYTSRFTHSIFKYTKRVLKTVTYRTPLPTFNVEQSLHDVVGYVYYAALCVFQR